MTSTRRNLWFDPMVWSCGLLRRGTTLSFGGSLLLTSCEKVRPDFRNFGRIIRFRLDSENPNPVHPYPLNEIDFARTVNVYSIS